MFIYKYIIFKVIDSDFNSHNLNKIVVHNKKPFDHREDCLAKAKLDLYKIQSNNTNPRTLFKIELIREDINYKLFKDRLESFQEFPVGYVSKEKLAAAGFMYSGHLDIVKCHCCKAKLANFHTMRGYTDYISKHQDLAQRQCTFLAETYGEKQNSLFWNEPLYMNNYRPSMRVMGDECDGVNQIELGSATVDSNLNELAQMSPQETEPVSDDHPAN